MDNRDDRASSDLTREEQIRRDVAMLVRLGREYVERGLNDFKRLLARAEGRGEGEQP